VAFYPMNDRIGNLNLAPTVSHFFLAIRRVRCASSGEAFAMRNLPALFVAAALVVVNATAIAQAPPGSLWYNGDWNMVNGLANERNTFYTQAAVYDDFDVTAPLGWNVTAIFSDNLLTTSVTAADWEIRTGVSEGNAGALIASGTTNSPIVTATGRCGFGLCEYMVEVTGLNVFLPMLPAGQHYWLNVTTVGNGGGRSFNTTTSGANCAGSPCGNDQNAFFNSTSFGTYFTSTANEGQPYDYSNGVIGTVVPEPATVALLTCGLGALLLALRRRRLLLRTTLPALFVTAAFVLNANAQAPPGSLWYNGDFNGVGAHANGGNTPNAQVWGEFDVTGVPWNLTAVFSDDLLNTVVTGAEFEIRSGGPFGTLIASGSTNSPIVTATGRSGFGFNEFMVEITGINVNLAPGLYWINVLPIGTGSSLNTTTSGANCVGMPCGNGMSYLLPEDMFTSTNFSMA
jgi:hypothetical protein